MSECNWGQITVTRCQKDGCADDYVAKLITDEAVMHETHGRTPGTAVTKLGAIMNQAQMMDGDPV